MTVPSAAVHRGRRTRPAGRGNADAAVWDRGTVSPRPVIGLLGPLVVRSAPVGDPGGAPVEAAVPGMRLRALLTRLAVGAGRPVGVAALSDAVWPDDAPTESANALQSLISRLRRVLGPTVGLVSDPGGYLLQLPPDDVDITVFRRLCEAGARTLAAGDPGGARPDLVAALALWRGDPLPDAGTADYAGPIVAELHERHLQASSDLIETDLRAGNAGQVIAPLEDLVAQHPLRESTTGQLMRALADTGRTADALAVYDRLRIRLVDELGIDPDPRIRDLHLAILRGESGRRTEPPAPAGSGDGGDPALPARTNIRVRRTSFLGRDREIARVHDHLTTGRLVTVVGPGGAGKTRLASEVGRAWLPQTRDGVWLVELAPVTDPQAVVNAMLSSLGFLDTRAIDRLRVEQARDTLEHLTRGLAGSDALLIIDNCEHVIDAAAAVVDEILARCPAVRVLATSREPLAIEGEALCTMPPLELPAAPDPDLDIPAPLDPDALGDVAAVRLFVERAAAVQADFRLDARTAPSVVDIVRRLDGLPLAIELAAARLRGMSVDEVAGRLSDRFTLLGGGSRTALPRHRTLRAVVEWSWDLLTEPERRIAEWLSVFPGGATVAAATEVLGAATGLDTRAVPDLIAALVEKSLVTPAPTETGPARYRMLETIREFGQDRLAARDELVTARNAHADYFARRVAELDPVLRTRDQLAALAELRAERDNVLAVVRHLGRSLDPQVRSRVMDTVLSLLWFWVLLGANGEAARWSGFVLDATADQDLPERPWVQALQAMASLGLEDAEPWARTRERLRGLALRLSDLPTPHSPLRVFLPTVLWFAGELDLSREAGEKLIADPDPWIRAAARLARMGAAENSGDLDALRDETTIGYSDFEALGERWGLASTLMSLGYVQAVDGDLTAAIDSYRRAQALSAELGSVEDNTLTNVRCAALFLRQGDPAAAEAELDASPRLTPHTVDSELLVESLRLQIRWAEGDLDGVDALLRSLRGRLAARRSSFLGDHVVASVAATCAAVGARRGDREAARADTVLAYRAAVETRDMPILASVGEAVAVVAADPSDPAGDEAAAVVVGAAVRVRGALDRGDRSLADLMTDLTERLGEPRLAELIARGRALDLDAAIAWFDPARLP